MKFTCKAAALIGDGSFLRTGKEPRVFNCRGNDDAHGPGEMHDLRSYNELGARGRQHENTVDRSTHAERDAMAGALNAGKITLKWNASTCATSNKIRIREGSSTGKLVVNKNGLTKTQVKRKSLEVGKTYSRRVLACIASNLCTPSAWQSFSVK